MVRRSLEERRKARNARASRVYRKRTKDGERIWRLPLDVVKVEHLLVGLGYLPEGFTTKEAETALARFMKMVLRVSADDARFFFELKEWIELAESLGDDMP